MGPAPSDEELVEEKVELEGLDPTDDELKRVHKDENEEDDGEKDDEEQEHAEEEEEGVVWTSSWTVVHQTTFFQLVYYQKFL